MIDKPTFVFLDRRQTVAESLASDGATFGFLLLCIWVSQGSTWWTFLTGAMFLSFLFAKTAMIVSTRQHRFRGLEEMAAWVDRERAKGEER